MHELLALRSFMATSSEKDNLVDFSDFIFIPGKDPFTEMMNSSRNDKTNLLDVCAENLFNDIRTISSTFRSPLNLANDFSDLSEDDKTFWRDYIGGVSLRYSKLNLQILPFTNVCMTCLITDEEIEKLAIADHNAYRQRQFSYGWKAGSRFDEKSRTDPSILPFDELTPKMRRFWIELNYYLPHQLKKAGFEIIRLEEISGINEKLIVKIARAIHSRYLRERRNSGMEVPEEYNAEFNDLPPDLKYSNIDNAYHIPAKLLSIGYRIRPAGKGYKPAALHLREHEVETMAKVEHLRWSWDKRLNGWSYGKVKDNIARRHPDIKPYNRLGKAEKEKDRELVRMIPAILQDIGYEACPVNPYNIRKLSYAAKPHSSIRRILDETRHLNEQIRNLVTLSPEVEEMARERNRKIEEAINEIEGSYNYAKHIQEAFLPDDLFIRECFPESFVLFKARDIVSGDFYFFSRHSNTLIFAAADCTGHGIPGALLSTIGYGTLDQAVNEIKLTNTVDILKHVYSKIHGFLRFGESISGMSDDMDIALCSYDMITGRLTYSGVANPLYHISGEILTEYRAGGIPKEWRETEEPPFRSEEIQLKAGDSIFVFSDGYTDQLGGKNHKRYQSGRFKNFLLEITRRPMSEQSDLLYEEFERWRGENNEDQTDDILVIGIRV